MLIRYADQMSATTVDVNIFKILDSVSESYLRACVKQVAIPRHFQAQTANNRKIAQWIREQLQSFGYQTVYQGDYANVVTLLPNNQRESCLLVGAHYDSLARTPGADDNASAIAALLACAKAVATYMPQTPVCFVAFNQEEDGMIGSKDFVTHYLLESQRKITQAHILEMVGYCQHTPASQKNPLQTLVDIPDVGDFLGIVGNQDALDLVDNTLVIAKSYLPGFPVIGLKVHQDLEHWLPVLNRSDHVPFWEAQIAALMWTDTAEFRNPHYHEGTDTPETLDYVFLRRVTQLLLAKILSGS